MNITKNIDGKIVTLALKGRLDTTTAPEFENAFDECISVADELIFDFAELEYISSAGLRVILKAQKAMNQKGNMKLINVNEDIMEIFDITGFLDILTIE